MKIGARDFVLEIGSGDNPKPRSDVLCDNAIDDDAERGGRIVTDRPIVEADAQSLPFRDGAFDYVICSHVLEHVEDPARMLQELMRVASRGYIETPSEIAERLYGWPFHRSVINLVDGALVIRRKDFVPQFGDLFHHLAAKDPLFRRFHLAQNRLFLVQYEWDGRIRYAMAPEGDAPGGPGPRDGAAIPSPAAVRTRWSDPWAPALKGAVPRRRVAAWGKGILARARRRPKRDLREIIVCPLCKGPVAWSEARIACERCAAEYPIIRDIPRLNPPRSAGPVTLEPA